MRLSVMAWPLALLLAGCATQPAAPLAPPADPTWPIGVADYRTTSESIYLGNLDARISELQRMLAGQDRPDQRTSLAGSLYHRYRVLGRVEDAEEALRLLDAAVAAEPGEGRHRATRAVVLSGFHRFEEALADLDAAAAGGVRPEELLGTRRDVLLARGDYDRLAQDFEKARELAPGFLELAHRADLRVQQGDLDGASFLYRGAQAEYRDVNPVPLAWLHVQQGIALLRYGRPAEALRFFEAAHARLPHYYLATEHLAETEARLGHRERARALYAQVIEQTGNPEFVAALSRLEAADGNAALAADLARRAETGYEALLVRNPSAYAQHAAQFFVAIDKPERAYQLARQNAALRQDIGSWILLAQAAHAAGDARQACEAREHALATGLHPPELKDLDAFSAACTP
jgi:tetratricopeptide (TPR) repeat protein